MIDRAKSIEVIQLADQIRAATNAPIEKAMATARAHLGISETRTPDEIEADDARLEKAHELSGDRQMIALGFRVVRFSFPKRTKQTEGIPDRRYYHPTRRIAFWWEAKSQTGRQRPDQKAFQELCDAVGDPYVLGTDQDLFAWLVERKIAVRDEWGMLVTPPAIRAPAEGTTILRGGPG